MSRCARPDLRELVPWLVNGSLEPTERSEIERHLEACDECAAEVERYEELALGLRDEAVEPPTPHPAQLEALFARLDRGDRGTEATSRPRWPSRLRILGRATPTPVRWLVAAQLASVLLLLLAADASGPSPGRFKTLSEPATAGVVGAGAARVVFAPETTEAEIRGLLLEARAEIVAGPSPHGVYTLALAPGSGSGSTESTVALLRSRAGVRFAEPLVTTDGSRR